MYHKVNDLPGNPLTMPVSIFDEQMDQLRDLDYTVVDLDAVLDHYVDGKALPERAVLITFDDGYHDNLDNAAGVLQQVRLPGRAVRSASAISTTVIRSRTRSIWQRRGSSTARSSGSELADLEREGIRIESHGISHRPLADLEVDEAAREIALSKLRLEERLGRPVRAFSYVKGSEAHYKPVHLSPRPAGRLRRRVHRGLGRELAGDATRCSSAATTSSPIPPRTFELVLAGACDLISLKDTVTGTHARRIFNAALGTSTK